MSEPAFVCPRCGAKSWNENDGKYGYCGRCHWWTGDPVIGDLIPADAEARLSADAGYAANLAYLQVLADAGYSGGHASWPTPLVPTSVLNAALRAGESARQSVMDPARLGL